jgi:hypothetical protein
MQIAVIGSQKNAFVCLYHIKFVFYAYIAMSSMTLLDK